MTTPMGKAAAGAMAMVVCVLVAEVAYPQLPGPPFDSSEAVVTPKLEEGYIEVEYPSSEEGDERETAKVPLPNQARPFLRVRVTQQNRLYRYAYELSNAPDAPESIANWQVAIPLDHLVDEVRVPKGWHHGLSKSRVPSIQEALQAERGVFLAWYPLSEPAKPIAAGATLAGFSCRSSLKPGLATAFVFSPWPDQGILKRLPLAAGRAVYPYLEYRYSSRMVLTAAPLYSPGEDELKIADSVRRVLNELITGGDEAEKRFGLDVARALDERTELLQAGKPAVESRAALCDIAQKPASSTTEEAVALVLHFNFCLP